ncbi:hypothetical protein Poli38472_014403 [Pythium oligandrum]|uniref:Glycoside hydrolase family 19 catalytic domain-containing protein n=1 Tax=Pythium oligandrum TaxID=41045 RepID=A0A8K1C7N0_PYTOL|nr:hypothetical protein Poli38472_014403 [Pythium oligandrum]|eukprot:TMW57800.1 hypothetical protein Poli38472_014403 [Pythium oligandrum]
MKTAQVLIALTTAALAAEQVAAGYVYTSTTGDKAAMTQWCNWNCPSFCPGDMCKPDCGSNPAPALAPAPLPTHAPGPALTYAPPPHPAPTPAPAPAPGKGTIHDVVTKDDGFAQATDIINGGLECGPSAPNKANEQPRIQYYKEICAKMGIQPVSKVSCN